MNMKRKSTGLPTLLPLFEVGFANVHSTNKDKGLFFVLVLTIA